MTTRDDWIYLNYAAITPIQKGVREAIDRCIDLQQRGGTVHYRELFEEVNRIRGRCGELIGAPARNIFFAQNTSNVMNAAALSLPLDAGASVLLPAEEFPANVRPWLHRRDKSGTRIHRVAMDGHRIDMDAIARGLAAGASVLSVSFVQYLAGYRADLEALGSLCRQYGAWFVVDAVQGVGLWPVDVARSRPDFLGASAHKALLGIEGIGIGYASDRALLELDVPWGGWLSVERPWEFHDDEQGYASDARRFEAGSPNLVGIWALGAAVDAALERGVDETRTYLLGLTDVLLGGLDRLGLEIVSPREAEHRSHIVSIRAPLPGLGARLEAKRIVVSERGPYLRFSPSCLTREEEIHSTIRTLEQVMLGEGP